MKSISGSFCLTEDAKFRKASLFSNEGGDDKLLNERRRDQGDVYDLLVGVYMSQS